MTGTYSKRRTCGAGTNPDFQFDCAVKCHLAGEGRVLRLFAVTTLRSGSKGIVLLLSSTTQSRPVSVLSFILPAIAGRSC